MGFGAPNFLFHVGPRCFPISQVATDEDYEAVYEDKLSFWVLLQMLRVLALVPLVGTFVSLWRPLLLAVAVVVGRPALKKGLSFTHKMVQRQTTGHKAPSKPPGRRPSAQPPSDSHPAHDSSAQLGPGAATETSVASTDDVGPVPEVEEAPEVSAEAKKKQ